MILKKEQLLKNASFEEIAKEGKKKALTCLNEMEEERWEHEMDWIRLQRLQNGFLEMWNIVDTARTSLGATICTARRGLENSMVAFSIGLTANYPLDHLSLPPFPFPDINLPLNVGITIDNANRNRLVQLAEVVYGKSMMRAGLPILKLNGIILEFYRC